MNCPTCGHDNIPGESLCSHCSMDLADLDIPSWGISSDDPIITKRVRDMPLKAPVSVPLGTPISEALARMCRHHEGCVFVVDPTGALAGVFTERDLTTRVLSRDIDTKTTPIDSVMTPDPISLGNDDPMSWALHRMGVDGYRHIPVVDDSGELAGFLSARTMLSVLQQA